MKHVALAVMVALGTLALAHQSHAAACANGVYRAGCVGPNGAAVVGKPARPITPNPRSPAPRGSTGRDAPDRMGPQSSAGRTSTVG